jgi:hypothetical protein
MGAHERAIRRIGKDIASASTSEERDQYLDYLLDVQNRATEWDGDHWGFDTDRWMEAERVEMERRGNPQWPGLRELPDA